MRTLSPQVFELAVRVAEAVAAVGHGQKEPIYAAACAELQISRATLMRALAKVKTRDKPRKKRTDAGTSGLTRGEADIISGYWLAHLSKDGRSRKPLIQAIEELRASGTIVAGRIDRKTGEIKPLDESSVTRALLAYGVHPRQLLAPDPVTELASEPNDCWQIDASLCVLFKLPAKGRSRIEAIGSDELYKNKLVNLAKIEHLLVQRYLVVDHASGACVLHFALGGESTDGILSALIKAILQRGGAPMYGFPFVLTVDRASANTSAMFRNFCRSTGIRLNIAIGARSKGSVEKHHHLIERAFESGLSCAPEIRDVDALNALADHWIHWFCGTKEMVRHGMSRYQAWQTIAPGRLRVTNLSADELRQLAREEPKATLIRPKLTVQFKGKVYDVSHVPGVMVGEKLNVTRSALNADACQVVTHDRDGNEVFIVCPEKKTDELGFSIGAARIVDGEYKRHADTPAQQAKKRIDQLVTGTDSVEAAEKAKKKRVVPFGGAVDPYAQMRRYTPPTYLPKRGTEIDTPRPVVVEKPITLTNLCLALKKRLGDGYRPEWYPRIAAKYPDGAPESEIAAIADWLRDGDDRRTKLVVVK